MTSCFLKNDPSQVAQAETPWFWSSFSPGTSSQRATAPVATMSDWASRGSFWLSTHTRFTGPWSSTLSASSVKNFVPKRSACARNSSISFGPVMPSGKPG